MKAIVTTTYGEHRIAATDGDGNTVRIPRDPALGFEEQHDAACRALCEKMEWRGTLAKGHMLTNGVSTGRVYVWTGNPPWTETLTVPSGV